MAGEQIGSWADDLDAEESGAKRNAGEVAEPKHSWQPAAEGQHHRHSVGREGQGTTTDGTRRRPKLDMDSGFMRYVRQHQEREREARIAPVARGVAGEAQPSREGRGVQTQLAMWNFGEPLAPPGVCDAVVAALERHEEPSRAASRGSSLSLSPPQRASLGQNEPS